MLLKPPGIILPQSRNIEALCNDFATYFAQKTQRISMQIHTALTNEEDCSDYAIDSGSQRLSRELDRMLPTIEEEIKNIIRLCPPRTCSLDSCPTDLLKKTVGVHVPYLVVIVINSFKQGLFPVTLKTAIIKPLLKSDTLDKDLLNNYRPVSNIAFVGKVLEKVAVRRLLDHLILNGLHEDTTQHIRCFTGQKQLYRVFSMTLLVNSTQIVQYCLSCWTNQVHLTRLTMNIC